RGLRAFLAHLEVGTLRRGCGFPRRDRERRRGRGRGRRGGRESTPARARPVARAAAGPREERGPGAGFRRRRDDRAWWRAGKESLSGDLCPCCRKRLFTKILTPWGRSSTGRAQRSQC